MLIAERGDSAIVISQIGRRRLNDPVGLAAEEMQRYVHAMTGAWLDMSDEQISNDTLWGLTLAPAGTDSGRLLSAARSAGRSLAGRHPDSYSIDLVGPIGAVVSNSQRGVLYATYRVLELAGIHFVAPSFHTFKGYHEVVPSLPRLDLSIAVVESPSFAVRRADAGEGWSIDAESLRAIVDWMAKQKRNTLVFPYDDEGRGFVRWDDFRQAVMPELERRGIAVETGGHGYQSFLRHKDHGHGHPEWFGLEDVSHREANAPNVFRAEHASAVSAYVDGVVEYVTQRPEVSIFEAWPPDFARWADSTVQRFGTASNAQAHITNQLVDALAEEKLEVTVATLSYHPVVKPPARDYAYHESVIIDFAPLDRDYGLAINSTSSEKNLFWPRVVQEWMDSGFSGTVGWYEYYRKMAWHSLPVLLPRLIASEIPFFRSIGVDAFGSGSYVVPGDWLVYELIHHLISALSWNSRLDGHQFVSSYLETRFPGSAERMEAVLDELERAGGTFFNSFLGSYESESVTRGTAASYRKCLGYLSDAEPTNGGEALLLEALQANLEFAEADMIMGASPARNREGSLERVNYQRAALRAARLGAVLYSPWIESRRANRGDFELGDAREFEPVDRYFAFYGRQIEVDQR